jgi:hypothetical protein
MRRQYSAVATTFFLVAIALAANHAEENTAVAREPASLPMSLKEQKLGHIEPALMRHTEKLHGSIETQIQIVGTPPEKAGDVFALRAIISTFETLSNVEFKWALPEGVELINGELKGVITSLAPGKPAEVELTLKTLTGENHQVHLLASSTNHGAHFAEAAHFNTLLEPVLVESRKQLSKSTQDSMEAESKSKIRVMH